MDRYVCLLFYFIIIIKVLTAFKYIYGTFFLKKNMCIYYFLSLFFSLFLFSFDKDFLFLMGRGRKDR